MKKSFTENEFIFKKTHFWPIISIIIALLIALVFFIYQLGKDFGEKNFDKDYHELTLRYDQLKTHLDDINARKIIIYDTIKLSITDTVFIIQNFPVNKTKYHLTKRQKLSSAFLDPLTSASICITSVYNRGTGTTFFAVVDYHQHDSLKQRLNKKINVETGFSWDFNYKSKDFKMVITEINSQDYEIQIIQK